MAGAGGGTPAAAPGRELMRQVIFPGDGSIQTAELDRPRTVDDWAVIRVAMVPLCTENKAFYAGETGWQ